MTDTRIDVFQNDINNKYRQIELQGSPENISKAGEKIYKIVNKYYFFDNSNRRNGDENSPSEEHGEYRVSKYEEHEDNATSNMRRPRIRLGNRNDRKKNRIEERRDVQEDRNNRKEINKTRENGIILITYKQNRVHIRKKRENVHVAV